MSKMSVIFTQAGELIKERGFCTFEYKDAKGALCIVGAVRVAQGLKPDPHAGFGKEYTHPEMFLKKELLGRTGRIENFNNYEVETKCNAIAFLELASELAA